MATFYEGLDLTGVCIKGWEQAQIMLRAPHDPRNKQGVLEALADRAVVLHPAGNSQAISIGIFESATSPGDAETQIGALI